MAGNVELLANGFRQGHESSRGEKLSHKQFLVVRVICQSSRTRQIVEMQWSKHKLSKDFNAIWVERSVFAMTRLEHQQSAPRGTSIYSSLPALDSVYFQPKSPPQFVLLGPDSHTNDSQAVKFSTSNRLSCAELFHKRLAMASTHHSSEAIAGCKEYKVYMMMPRFMNIRRHADMRTFARLYWTSQAHRALCERVRPEDYRKVTLKVIALLDHPVVVASLAARLLTNRQVVQSVEALACG